MLSALSSFALSFLLHFAMDAFKAWRAEEDQKATGRAEAVADGRDAAAASARIARAEEAATDAAHRGDPSDGAFDQDFKRAD